MRSRLLTLLILSSCGSIDSKHTDPIPRKYNFCTKTVQCTDSEQVDITRYHYVTETVPEEDLIQLCIHSIVVDKGNPEQSYKLDECIDLDGRQQVTCLEDFETYSKLTTETCKEL